MGLSVSAKADVEYNLKTNCVTYHFYELEKILAIKKMTMEEFAASWTGEKIGEEWDGSDIGAMFGI